MGNFSLKRGCGTKSSDCYALGMTIYEVLSGHVPFYKKSDHAPVPRILKGERPERPQGIEGVLFMDDIWGILESCWKPAPGDRPTVDRVLQCLEEASGFWTPLPPLSPASSISDISTPESEMGDYF